MSALGFVGSNNANRGVKPRILFVDDEPPIRELLSLYLRKKGLEVTTAMTAQEARDIAAKAPVSLAILDINLVGESGLELLSYFRSTYPSVPVILFTGLTGQESGRESPGWRGLRFYEKNRLPRCAVQNGLPSFTARIADWAPNRPKRP